MLFIITDNTHKGKGGKKTKNIKAQRVLNLGLSRYIFWVSVVEHMASFACCASCAIVYLCAIAEDGRAHCMLGQ